MKKLEPINSTSGQITTTGIIIPVEWDEDGNPTAIAISTYDENEYIIDGGHGPGEDLKRYLRKKMIISGFLDRESPTKHVIKVTYFSRIQEKEQE